MKAEARFRINKLPIPQTIDLGKIRIVPWFVSSDGVEHSDSSSLDVPLPDATEADSGELLATARETADLATLLLSLVFKSFIDYDKVDLYAVRPSGRTLVSSQGQPAWVAGTAGSGPKLIHNFDVLVDFLERASPCYDRMKPDTRTRVRTALVLYRANLLNRNVRFVQDTYILDFVVLELLIAAFSEDTKALDRSTFRKKIRMPLVKIINELDCKSRAKEILEEKINELNRPSLRRKAITVLKDFEIRPLEDELKKLIRLRNLWLHGESIPTKERKGLPDLSTAVLWADNLVDRLLVAILGCKNDFTRSPWLYMGTHRFSRCDPL